MLYLPCNIWYTQLEDYCNCFGLMKEKRAHPNYIKEDAIGKIHPLLLLLWSHAAAVSLNSFKMITIYCRLFFFFFFLEGTILIYVREMLWTLTVFCLNGLELQCNLLLRKYGLHKEHVNVDSMIRLMVVLASYNFVLYISQDRVLCLSEIWCISQ